MLRLLRKPANAESHEELFVERFKRLRAWARQLADGDLTRAEDLVQDAFIQFTVARPDLSTIRNLDGYLYEILRNLHLSQIRRATRNRVQQLSIVEYESAETGLLKVEPRDPFKVREELLAVCHYACERKQTSKTGSILILRFFHGYYPSEIASVLNCTNQVVRFRLLIARREAKHFLEAPCQPGAGRKRPESGVPEGQAESNWPPGIDGALGRLRRTIFESRPGTCPPRKMLRERYRTGSASLDAFFLAHLVSCPECLDEVNRILGLPTLDQRFPTDTLGPEKDGRMRGRRKQGGGPDRPAGGASTGDPLVRRCRRQAREAFEHHPQELHISVNGFILGSRHINAGTNDLTLDISLSEPISFVEAFSEQEIRLLLFRVGEPPPFGPVEQFYLVELSEGRTLEVTLKFRYPWPTLQIVYRDPSLEFARIPAVEEQREGLGIRQGEHESNEPEPPGTGSSSRFGFAKRTRHRLGSLRGLLTPALGVSRAPLRRRIAITAISLALLLVAATTFLPWRDQPEAVEAAELLRSSAAAEESMVRHPNLVIHRTINLEERVLSSGAMRTAEAAGLTPDLALPNRYSRNRRIEIWQGSGRHQLVRRLFDDQGYLIAGHWIREDGSKMSYRREEGISIPQESAGRGAEALQFDTVWEVGLSAGGFRAIVPYSGTTRVRKADASVEISYDAGSNLTGEGLVTAKLSLSRADLHALEQTLVLRVKSEVREFRFVETSFERRPTAAVAASVFEPDAEILTEAELRKRGSMAGPKSIESRPVVQALLPSVTDLELQVLTLLSRAGADLDEQTWLTRTGDGRLRLGGIVESDKRKSEVLSALAPVASNHRVIVEIRTLAEAVGESAPVRPRAEGVSIERVQVTQNSIASYPELSRYFSREGRSADEEIGRFAARIVNHSSQALSHLGAMKRLLGRFSAADVRAMSAESHAQWVAIFQTHAKAVHAELERIRLELQPVFFPNQPFEPATDFGELQNEGEFVHAIDRLVEMGNANDRMLRAALTTSTGEADVSGLGTQQSWRSLSSAEQLARRLAGE